MPIAYEAAGTSRANGSETAGKREEMAKVYVVGTMDTKGAELRYAAERVRAAGAEPVLVDVSTQGVGAGADIAASVVATHHPDGSGAVLGLTDRGQAVSAMAKALSRYLATRTDIGKEQKMAVEEDTVAAEKMLNSLKSDPTATDANRTREQLNQTIKGLSGSAGKD